MRFFCGSMHVFLIPLTLTIALLSPTLVFAQETTNITASELFPRTELFFSTASGSFLQGSTFEVPIYIDTRGNKINTIELRVRFDPNRLRVVKPSGGTSIIGLWVGAPSYDNERGILHIAGTIPGGIRTDSGLIVTITFEAKTLGNASVSITDDAQVLLNDGLGSPTEVHTNRATFTILPKAPEGPAVVSDTHPFSDHWYNNPNPALWWDAREPMQGFSYTLDTIPTTMPENAINATNTVKAFEKLGNGLWYFHIKAHKQGVWGSPTHFPIRIDTVPPAEFTPSIEYMRGELDTRYLLSFFTTDNLSGIDSYEVGVIDPADPSTVSPVFVTAQSPYPIPAPATGQIKIIIRAFDKAGNVREASIMADEPFFLTEFIVKNAILILTVFLATIIALLIAHYLFGHHLLRRLERGIELAEKEGVERSSTPPQ